MYIGILQLTMRIDGAFSLKDKRKVLRSVLERLDQRYNISHSEIDHQEIHNLSTVAIVAVSGSYSHIDDVLNKIMEYLETDFRYEIIDIDRQII